MRKTFWYLDDKTDIKQNQEEVLYSCVLVCFNNLLQIK